jgi:hypothetical protein
MDWQWCGLAERHHLHRTQLGGDRPGVGPIYGVDPAGNPIIASSRPAPGMQVRWGTFGQAVEKTPWTDCAWARPEGDVLIVCHHQVDGAEEFTWIPLHVVRGPIEYRPKPDAGTDR